MDNHYSCLYCFMAPFSRFFDLQSILGLVSLFEQKSLIVSECIGLWVFFRILSPLVFNCGLVHAYSAHFIYWILFTFFLYFSGLFIFLVHLLRFFQEDSRFCPGVSWYRDCLPLILLNLRNPLCFLNLIVTLSYVTMICYTNLSRIYPLYCIYTFIIWYSPLIRIHYQELLVVWMIHRIPCITTFFKSRRIQKCILIFDTVWCFFFHPFLPTT